MSTLARDWHDVETDLVDRGFTAKPDLPGRGHTLTACFDGDDDIEIVAVRGPFGDLWRVVVCRRPRTSRPGAARFDSVELPGFVCTAFALAVITAACAPLPTTGPTSRSTR